MMKNKLIIILLLISLFLTFFIGRYSIKSPDIIADTIIKTDTTYIRDTFETVKYQTNIKIKKEVKKDTFYTKEGQDTVISTNNYLFQDTICQGKDSLILKNFITGQNVRQDSLKVLWKKQDKVITNVVEITKKEKRKPSIKPMVGVGYGMINRKPDVFVGIGITF